MKKIITSTLLLASVFIAGSTHAQDLIKGNKGMYPSYVSFKNAPQAFAQGKVILTDEAGKAQTNSVGLLKNKETDNVGFEHYRYQQTYAGIPVENAVYILHVKNGAVQSENGEWIKDFPASLDISPDISGTDAIQSAMNFVGATKYKWQLASEEVFLKREQNNTNATFYPTANLVLYSVGDEINPSNLKLAYKLDIYAQLPISRQIVYVDANTGAILGKNEMIHTTNAAGTATTAFSGTQAITTDNTGTTYRLRETGRGNGINTYNLQKGTNYASAVDFTDADNNWNNVNANKDQYATDAHFGTEKTYDYYLQKHNRNSVDNAGLALNSYVHYSTNYVNAFWDGTRMTYGDGDATYKPLTSLDICGHEVTHGVTERTSNLTYSNQSGAMNEGFSDIFGTCIEFFARNGSGNWNIGEDIGAAFRSMSNPNQYSQPDTYLGTYWYTGTADNGGVHTNSGVLNFWFYTLSQGGSGTNDIGNAFTVIGIGMDKAAAIAYRTNTTYLTASSNYANARTYAIQSAIDLYGAGSAEVIATTNAWYAVGVGAAYNPGGCSAPTGLAASAITTTSATISWAAVSGAASYLVEYKANASATWVVFASASTATSASLTSLVSGTLYNYRITTNCATSTSTATAAQFTTGSVATGCAAAFEPNETLATAIAITSGTTNSAAIGSATDIDYYKITTTGTGSIVYNLVGPTGVDYDLYVYNSAGTQIGSGAGATATETVSLTAQAAGTYYIKVMGYSGANSATCYTIKATATVVTGCISTYDNSTNGTSAGAATIPFNTNINGLINASGDIDNYKFVITTAGTITITLGTLPADYDLKLLNSAGTLVAISQNGSTTAETITYAAAAGTYYAQVYGYSTASNATTCYTLKAQLGTATIFANNNTEITQTEKLKVYPNPVSDFVNLSVKGILEKQNVVNVIDVNGKVVMTTKLNSNLQQINVSTLPKGVYMITVNNGGSKINTKFVKM